jgi:hypothetical protein
MLVYQRLGPMNIKGSFITVFSPELIKGVVQPLVCIVSVPSPTMSRWDMAPHPHAIASTAFHSGDPWHTLGHPGEKSRSREDPFRKDKRQNLWYIPYYNIHIYISMIYPLLPIFIYLEPQKRTVISTCLKEISTGHDAVFFRLSVCRVSNE